MSELHDVDDPAGPFPCNVYPSRGHSTMFAANVCAITLENVHAGNAVPPNADWLAPLDAMAEQDRVARESVAFDVAPAHPVSATAIAAAYGVPVGMLGTERDHYRARARRLRFWSRAVPLVAGFSILWYFTGPALPPSVVLGLVSLLSGWIIGREIWLATR